MTSPKSLLPPLRSFLWSSLFLACTTGVLAFCSAARAEDRTGILQSLFDDGVEHFTHPTSIEPTPATVIGPQTDPGAIMDGETTVPPFDAPLPRLFEPEDLPSAAVVVPEKKKKKWYDQLSIRGYTHFRFSEVVHSSAGSAPPHHAGDGSISDDRNFLIRRARLVLSGNVHDRVFIYFQPDFAVSVPGSPDSEYYTQLRDLYADLYLTEDKVHRFRIGQSKVPYGWANIQSSSNRVPLDRDDGLNSAVKNERDLGIFYYYTPTWVQDVFTDVMERNLKGSGNYGMFGVGIYNGQGGSLRERNDEVHTVVRMTYPIVTPNDQIMEIGIQGYTGEYVVLGSPIQPLGVGPVITPAGTGSAPGQRDQRLAASFILYPQPWGLQAEWNVGRGPALNESQTAVVDRSLYGGYAMLLYKHDSDSWGSFFPFARYSHFTGGHKSFRNAPYSVVNDWELGCEWQPNSAVEVTTSYLFADRTNLDARSTGRSYLPFEGQALRFQVQLNY